MVIRITTFLRFSLFMAHGFPTNHLGLICINLQSLRSRTCHHQSQHCRPPHTQSVPVLSHIADLIPLRAIGILDDPSFPPSVLYLAFVGPARVSIQDIKHFIYHRGTRGLMKRS